MLPTKLQHVGISLTQENGCAPYGQQQLQSTLGEEFPPPPPPERSSPGVQSFTGIGGLGKGGPTVVNENHCSCGRWVLFLLAILAVECDF